MKRISFIIDVDFNPYFWAFIPAINANFHSKSLEIEWLFVGIYISKKPTE
jgi:hypothetical protein